MGTDKSFLELGGKALIERVIDVFGSAFSRTIIVTNEPEKYSRFGLEIKRDVVPGVGTLGGIHAGLFYLEDNAAFFAASDMPFIKRELIEYLVAARQDSDAAVPYFNGYYEPLFAVYSKRCLGAVQKRINSGTQQAISFLKDVNVRLVGQEEILAVDGELLSFFNINTPQDYERAKLIAVEKDR
jgi:molybdopterin-guanine dinucleotide biosynthesis protein A